VVVVDPVEDPEVVVVALEVEEEDAVAFKMFSIYFNIII
jgi:hypothetical protein